MPITTQQVKELAAACGFELAGVTAATPHADYARFAEWRAAGYAGEMTYLTDRRGDLRSDPRHLLPAAQTVICVGKLYHSHSVSPEAAAHQARISRYAQGSDYHAWMRRALEELGRRIEQAVGEGLNWRACVDTAPLLERSYAQAAGLGWIGKNTCLINQAQGSWFFLGELLLSAALAPDFPAPARCGSCTRCIDACPTAAIVPGSGGADTWALDARRCISYLTIEKRGAIDPELAASLSNHVFGCDICQDVCPWNGRTPSTGEPAFEARDYPRELSELAALDSAAFRELFRHSPVWRAKHEGFLRNVAIAMGNSKRTDLLEPLQRLSEHPAELVSETARRALAHLHESLDQECAP